MRCKFLRGFPIIMAAYAVSGVWLAVASVPDAIKESPIVAMPRDGDQNAAKPITAASQAKQKSKPANTPADTSGSRLAPRSTAEPAVQKDATKRAASSAELKPVEQSARQMAESQDAPPVAVETASFKGVIPGVSTKADVENAWGKPKDTTQVDGTLVQLYSVEPFNRVEISYASGKVSSIVIHFPRSFPRDVVAKQLGLTAIRPVPVSNDVGELLGLAYPERGVLFTFEPSNVPGKSTMKVPQVILEPISAEAFVLRAETTIESRPDLSRRDLEEAIKLEPDTARGYWLLSRIRAGNEEREKALAAAREAIRLEDDPQYRVTYAQILAQAGRLSEAAEEAKRAVEKSEGRPHIKARAICLLADLMASGPKPDFKQALELHGEAIQLADPLRNDAHPAIRRAAKRVLVDAHLGAAHDIAWGPWKEKAKAVARWLERAAETADDMVANDDGSRQVLFRLHARSLAVYVGLRGEIDPEPSAKAVLAVGEKLIAATRQAGRKAQLQWELGMALYDAVQVCQMRSDNDGALRHGEEAVKYLVAASDLRPSPSATLLLGRLYFRLGAIQAISRHDHKAAAGWFDKAVPLFDRLAPEDVTGSLGRHGEAIVTMGVTYWEVGRHKEAIVQSQKGIRWMERAVEQGTLDRSALAVPYANLAAMHRKLGADDQADRFQDLASRLREETLR